jgi:hypothetical protein
MPVNMFTFGRKLVETGKNFGKSLVPPKNPTKPYMMNRRQSAAFDQKSAEVKARREEAYTRQAGLFGAAGVGTVLLNNGENTPAPAKTATSSTVTSQPVAKTEQTKTFIPWRERKVPSSSSVSKTPEQKKATGISSSVTQRDSVDMTPMERVKSTPGYITRHGRKPRGKMAALERHRERTAAAKRKESVMSAQQKRIDAEMAKANNNKRVSVSTPMDKLASVNRTMSYLESFNGSKPSSAPSSPNPRTEVNNNDPYGLKAQGEDIRKRYEARSKARGY